MWGVIRGAAIAVFGFSMMLMGMAVGHVEATGAPVLFAGFALVSIGVLGVLVGSANLDQRR